MDLSSLRTLVTGLNFEAFGLPITVTPPGPGALTVDTRGIWLTPITDDHPAGFDLKSREPERVLAIEAPLAPVPLRTVIHAPLARGGEILRWFVDGFDRIEVEHSRVRLIPAPGES